MSSGRLLLPYVSQLGPGAEYGQGDCGLACVTAHLHALGHSVTVDDVCEKAGLKPGFVSAHITNDIRRAANLFGVSFEYQSHLTIDQIEQHIKDCRSVILLVFYPRLIDKHSSTYSDGHYITVFGHDQDDFHYHDPFWPENEGEDRRIPKSALIDASNATGNHFRTPGQGLVLESPLLSAVESEAVDEPSRKDPTVGFADLDSPKESGRPLLRFTGRVLKGDRGVANASLRLQGARETLGAIPGAVHVPTRKDVIWSRILSGFAGDLKDCWEQLVRDETGLSFRSFEVAMLAHNPELEADGRRLEAAKEYVLPERPFVVGWTRPVKGAKGTRQEVYLSHVQEEVVGITPEVFFDEVLRHNPHIDVAQPVLDGRRTYRFPENLYVASVVAPVVAWTRKITDFTGNRWDAWMAHVQDQVEGITWTVFKDEVLQRNPKLSESPQPVFSKGSRYVLPENQAVPRFEIHSWTDDTGRFVFDTVPEGTYEVICQIASRPAWSQQVVIHANTDEDIAVPDPNRPEPAVVAELGRFARTDGSLFKLAGIRKPMLGLNIRGLVHYGDGTLLKASSAPERETHLDFARETGARVVRVFGANRHLSHSEGADRLAAALEAARARDMYLLVALTDVHSDTGFNPRGDDPSFYSEKGKLNRAFYDGGYQQNYLPYVSLLAQRFQDDDRIFAWELANEPKPMHADGLLPETFIHFARAVSDAIRAVDRNHLITTGIINSRSIGCSAEQASRLYTLPNIDFLTAHVYDSKGDGNLSAEELDWQRMELQRLAEFEIPLAREVGKPLVVEEVGLSGDDRPRRFSTLLEQWYAKDGIAMVMPWGIMATNADNGDGDRRYGIDRPFHGADFDAMKSLLRERGEALR